MYFLLEKEILIYDKFDWSIFINVIWNDNWWNEKKVKSVLWENS